jgi:hypothetical protein
MEGFNVVMETNLQGMDLNLKYVVRGVILTNQGLIICPRNIVGMIGRMTNASCSSSKGSYSNCAFKCVLASNELIVLVTLIHYRVINVVV